MDAFDMSEIVAGHRKNGELYHEFLRAERLSVGLYGPSARLSAVPSICELGAFRTGFDSGRLFWSSGVVVASLAEARFSKLERVVKTGKITRVEVSKGSPVLPAPDNASAITGSGSPGSSSLVSAGSFRIALSVGLPTAASPSLTASKASENAGSSLSAPDARPGCAGLGARKASCVTSIIAPGVLSPSDCIFTHKNYRIFTACRQTSPNCPQFYGPGHASGCAPNGFLSAKTRHDSPG